MRELTKTKLRDQLFERRQRLESAISDAGEAADLVRLLREVDSALGRVDSGNFGTCLVCNLAIGDDLLAENPMAQYCLCDLSRDQQIALQHDLTLASHVQLALLPKQNTRFAGWEAHFRYIPAGPVSGDYCDLVPRNDDTLFFLIGDVSGKGVAASLFMARLNALFRSLLGTGSSATGMVEQANRLLADSAIPSHYATLVCGKAEESGRMEICNAGHCCPLLLRDGDVAPVESTGFPLGIFDTGPYEARTIDLAPGDTLFLFTDGLSEARNRSDQEYGTDRIADFLRENPGLPPQDLAAACLRDVNSFLDGEPQTDDLTMMVLRKT